MFDISENNCTVKFLMKNIIADKRSEINMADYQRIQVKQLKESYVPLKNETVKKDFSELLQDKSIYLEDDENFLNRI